MYQISVKREFYFWYKEEAILDERLERVSVTNNFSQAAILTSSATIGATIGATISGALMLAAAKIALHS